MKCRLACYSLFLNRDPGDTPGKKGDRLAATLLLLFFISTALRRTRTSKLVYMKCHHSLGMVSRRMGIIREGWSNDFNCLFVQLIFLFGHKLPF